MQINHYDLYRIKSSRELINLNLFEDYLNSITLIEWPQIIEEKPTNLIELSFNYSENFKKICKNRWFNILEMKKSFLKNLKKIKGDASSRIFFRKRDKQKTSIIVKVEKEKEKNLLTYDAINKILNKNQIYAPKLFREKYDDNFIEIEDFGNLTLLKKLKKKNVNKLKYLKLIIKILERIQTIRNKKVKNFKNKIYIIPQYRKKILLDEANLFCEWYIKKITKNSKKKFNLKFKKIMKRLSLKLKLKNNVFVHRDFHVSNLMLVKKIGIIDSQDALIGNKAYDLASLIDDVRFKTSKLLKYKIYNYYIKKQK